MGGGETAETWGVGGAQQPGVQGRPPRLRSCGGLGGVFDLEEEPIVE